MNKREVQDGEVMSLQSCTFQERKSESINHARKRPKNQSAPKWNFIQRERRPFCPFSLNPFWTVWVMQGTRSFHSKIHYLSSQQVKSHNVNEDTRTREVIPTKRKKDKSISQVAKFGQRSNLHTTKKQALLEEKQTNDNLYETRTHLCSCPKSQNWHPMELLTPCICTDVEHAVT